ncbi:MAG: hypothetical protein MJB57_06425 [Gemmatimonadetes bacterium]|nr:hypothetical protein [Gemmatimonadota bacterium]
MPVFGAAVTASWESDGEPRSAEYMVPDDGVYLICGVPVGARVTLTANFSGRESEPTEIRLDERAKRQDLIVYLSGTNRSDNAPLIIGPDNSGRCADLQAPRLVQCYLIDECRYERVSGIRARKVGSGSDNRELVETFVRNARQKDVDAVRDVRAQYEQRGLEIVLVMIEGIGVKFTEERCKRWAANPNPM